MPFVYTKWKNFNDLYYFQNCKVSLFPRSGKNEVIFCIYLYIPFYFHEVQHITQHVLFAGSTNNYLIFLVALYFTNAFCFHEVEKNEVTFF